MRIDIVNLVLGFPGEAKVVRKPLLGGYLREAFTPRGGGVKWNIQQSVSWEVSMLQSDWKQGPGV